MKKKVMALIGDFYHPDSYIRKGMEALTETGEWSIELKTDPGDVPWDDLKAFDALILFQMGQLKPKESKEFWMTTRHQEIIENFVNEGGGLLVLHSGSASQPLDGPFRKLIKGHFTHHPPEHPTVKISVVNESHPVSENVEYFEVIDEHYFVELDEGETDILLKAASEHGTAAACWAHAHGKGRVCCLMPGHTEQVLKHPMMQRLCSNSLKWCLKMK